MSKTVITRTDDTKINQLISMWCFNYASTLQLLALLLIFTSQTVGQELTEEVCSAKYYGGKYASFILCPPGSDVSQSNVWFRFNEKGDSLDITCNNNLSTEQLESYLASVPRVKKQPVNLTHLKLTGCPAPGGSELELESRIFGSLFQRWMLKAP